MYFNILFRALCISNLYYVVLVFCMGLDVMIILLTFQLEINIKHTYKQLNYVPIEAMKTTFLFHRLYKKICGEYV